MVISVRPLRADEARTFLEVHRASVHTLAAKDYPPEVLGSWAAVPVSDQHVEQFIANGSNEIRLLAEVNERPVGIGAIVLDASELRACYVEPSAARSGVGTAIVKEIERIAMARGLRELTLDSSLTAEPFYAALGYEVVERGEHRLRSGVVMAAVKMRKGLL